MFVHAGMKVGAGNQCQVLLLFVCSLLFPTYFLRQGLSLTLHGAHSLASLGLSMGLSFRTLSLL